MNDEKQFGQRRSDKWYAPFVGFWDFIDQRGIDKHAVSIVIMMGTIRISEWAMSYAASHADMANSVGIAAIIAAVTAPYMALQAAAIKFYFEARR